MSEQSTTPGTTIEAPPTPGISIDRAVLRCCVPLTHRLHTFLDARSHSLNMPQQRDISPKGPILRWRPAQD